MRKLIEDCIFKQQFSIYHALRKEWNDSLIRHYKVLIRANQDSPQLSQALKQELLYYRLFGDKEDGFKYWNEQVKGARSGLEKVALCNEMLSFQDKFKIFTTDEVIVINMERMKALVECGEYGYYEDAQRVIDELDSFDALNEHQKQSLDTHKLVVLLRSKDHDATKVEVPRYEELINNVVDFSHEEPQMKGNAGVYMPAFLDAISLVGYHYRLQSKNEEAAGWYEKGLKLINLDPKLEKSTPNISLKINLAYVCHLMGKDAEANKYVKAAHRISIKLSDKYREGLCNNVMGIIEADSLREPQAVNYFRAALDCFTEIRNNRGVAMVNIAYARMLRQLGWTKVKPRRGLLKESRNNYLDAKSMLEDVISLIKDGSIPVLAEAYNELGCLYRDMGDFQNAIKYLRLSLDYSEKMNNDYGKGDNYQDLSITYYLIGKREEAARMVDMTIKLAEENTKKLKDKKVHLFPHLLAKAYRTKANIESDKAKEGQQVVWESVCSDAAKSLVYMLRVDKGSLDEGLAKKTMHYFDWVDWLSDLVINSIKYNPGLNTSERIASFISREADEYRNAYSSYSESDFSWFNQSVDSAVNTIKGIWAAEAT